MGRLTLVHQLAGFVNDETEFVNVIGKGFDYFSAAHVTAAEFETGQKVFRKFPAVGTSKRPYREDSGPTQSE